jgi:hypothetical protein
VKVSFFTESATFAHIQILIMRTALFFLLLVSYSTFLLGQAPEWFVYLDSVSVFSSPKAADLTGDGTPDMVIGGGAEGASRLDGVAAINGASGNRLWTHPVRDQLYGTALFRDITGDQVPEVFTGGRNAQYFALDGSSGVPVWEFFPDSLGKPADLGWYNFYNAQWIPDQNNDSVPDLVITNGGDASAFPSDTTRPAGRLMILSATDGSIIAMDTMPDGRETYCTPLVVEWNDTLRILFGSGGETVRGKYWEVKLSELRNNDISNARILASDNSKGFIAVPSLADLNGDQETDIIIPALNRKMIAIDGQTRLPLWTVDMPGAENYVSPAIGRFTGDASPDVFGIFAIGVFPFYSGFIKVLIDGSDGSIVWQDTTPVYQFSQVNAIDKDGDGTDEILLIRNWDAGFSVVDYRNIFSWFDPDTKVMTDFGFPRIGLNIYSTPLISDFDLDGFLDIVFVYNTASDSWYAPKGARIERIDTGIPFTQPAWGGYMGNNGDGYYSPQQATSLEFEDALPFSLFPNPAKDFLKVSFEGNSSVPARLTDMQGRILRSILLHPDDRIDLGGINPGVYILTMQMKGNPVSRKVILIP